MEGLMDGKAVNMNILEPFLPQCMSHWWDRNRCGLKKNKKQWHFYPGL